MMDCVLPTLLRLPRLCMLQLFKELMKEDTPGHLGGLDAASDAAAGDGTPAANGAGATSCHAVLLA